MGSWYLVWQESHYFRITGIHTNYGRITGFHTNYGWITGFHTNSGRVPSLSADSRSVPFAESKKGTRPPKPSRLDKPLEPNTWWESMEPWYLGRTGSGLPDSTLITVSSLLFRLVLARFPSRNPRGKLGYLGEFERDFDRDFDTGSWFFDWNPYSMAFKG